jgi:hypothetical protein
LHIFAAPHYDGQRRGLRRRQPRQPLTASWYADK